MSHRHNGSKRTSTKRIESWLTDVEGARNSRVEMRRSSSSRSSASSHRSTTQNILEAEQSTEYDFRTAHGGATQTEYSTARGRPRTVTHFDSYSRPHHSKEVRKAYEELNFHALDDDEADHGTQRNHENSESYFSRSRTSSVMFRPMPDHDSDNDFPRSRSCCSLKSLPARVKPKKTGHVFVSRDHNGRPQLERRKQGDDHRGDGKKARIVGFMTFVVGA